MIDFLFVYEHKAREIESLCLLKAALERKGYKVDIVQVHERRLLKYSLWRKPKVVVPFAIYDDSSFERHIIDIVGRIKKVVNMQWEQALSANDIKSGFHVPKGMASDAVHICWGDNGYNLLKENEVKKGVIVGAVQMDFLHGKLKSLYMDRETIERKYNLPKGRMLLFISTFVFASMTANERKRYENIIHESVEKNMNRDKKLRGKILEWFKHLLDDYPDLYVVYRPHPGENIDSILLNHAAANPRFYIVPDESVKQWILVSDEITTYYSSSVSEVYYANKSCMILRPVKVDEDDEILYFRNGRFVSTYEELKDELENKNRLFPIPANNITKCYGEIDNVYSYEKIIALLEEVYTSDKYDLGFKIGYFKTLKGPLRRAIKGILLHAHIDRMTFLSILCPGLYEKIEFLYYSEKKFSEEFVSREFIETETQLIKQIIG